MENKSDNFGIALYYPFINVQDIDWLKCALLYWDGIRCITPSPDYFEGDIEYLFDKGLIKPTNPKEYSMGASVKFVRKIQEYCHNQGELDVKVRNYLEKKFPQLKYVTIHNEKLCEKVFQEMGHKVILGGFEDGISEFYQAQPYISALYLMVLAAEMSKKINAPMLTDILGLSGLGQRILWSDEIVPSVDEPENFLLQLDIQFPSAKELMNLTFDDIIIFRKNRTDERRRFRRAVEEIRRHAQGIKDTNALTDYLNDQKQEIQQAIDDHNKSLRDIGIKNFTSSVLAVCPSLFGIEIEKIAGETAGILSAIGLVGITLAFNKTTISQEYRRATKECPWHYMINLERDLR